MDSLTLRFAAWITTVCAMLEFFVGVSCNSLALTTDSGYMASDACALFMAIWAINNIKIRSLMVWLSSFIMLSVVLYMINEAITALQHPEPMMSKGVLIVSVIGLLVNIWVSKRLVKMEYDQNIKVAHLHVICDMLGSTIAVISGFLGLFGVSSNIDICLTLISAFGVGSATIIIMYKMLVSAEISELSS